MIYELVQMPKPQTEYLNNTKVANYIATPSSQETLFTSTIQLTTIPKKNIVVTVDLATDENLSVSNPNITAFDMAVMDAIYTLLVNGSPIFTPQMIVRVMTGNFDQNVTPQKASAVTRSINKLKYIEIAIDCTEELRTRKLIKKDQFANLKSFMLQFNEVDILSANHKTVMKGYQLTGKPILYIYAETVKQIIAVPTELLAIANISNTDDVIIIKRALIRRIELMKNSKNHMDSNAIRYERYDTTTSSQKGFFSSLGFDETNYKSPKQWAKKKNSLHKTITAILDDFIKETYITGYEVSKEGKQKIIGVKIII